MDIRELLRNTCAGSNFVHTSVRMRILRATGLKLGGNTAIASGVTFKGGTVTIGERSFFNHGVYVDRGELTIGTDAHVGPRVVFATRNHKIGGSEKRAGDNVDQPIIVGNGTWTGANATILGGIRIAPGCIIAAGADVTKDTDKDGPYAGVPALRIMSLA